MDESQAAERAWQLELKSDNSNCIKILKACNKILILGLIMQKRSISTNLPSYEERKRLMSQFKKSIQEMNHQKSQSIDVILFLQAVEIERMHNFIDFLLSLIPESYTRISEQFLNAQPNFHKQNYDVENIVQSKEVELNETINQLKNQLKDQKVINDFLQKQNDELKRKNTFETNNIPKEMTPPTQNSNKWKQRCDDLLCLCVLMNAQLESQQNRISFYERQSISYQNSFAAQKQKSRTESSIPKSLIYNNKMESK